MVPVTFQCRSSIDEMRYVLMDKKIDLKKFGLQVKIQVRRQGPKKLVFDTTYIISKHILVLEFFIFVGGSTHFEPQPSAKCQLVTSVFLVLLFHLIYRILLEDSQILPRKKKTQIFSPKKQAENHPSQKENHMNQTFHSLQGFKNSWVFQVKCCMF